MGLLCFFGVHPKAYEFKTEGEWNTCRACPRHPRYLAREAANLLRLAEDRDSRRVSDLSLSVHEQRASIDARTERLRGSRTSPRKTLTRSASKHSKKEKENEVGD